MRSAYGVGVCLLAGVMMMSPSLKAEDLPGPSFQSLPEATSTFLPSLDWQSQLSLHGNRNGRTYGAMSPDYSRDIEVLLFEAVKNRLGIPYRSGGVDDRGYDCSGFVWRVFQDAGIDFDRMPARFLWETLPPAEGKDQRRFGTLVFFNELGHVGIVRDGTSFYHASTSKGVIRSYYDEYWAPRIVGFRRVYIPAEKLKGVGKNDILAERSAKPAKRSPVIAERESRLASTSTNRQPVKMAAELPDEKPAKKKKGFFRWLWR